ncbi:MAG: hypothetical protein LUQ65_02865 [Candidatus Helarchaeota archaeon]|nr:hypothetical protein [Candidatus Helarchaeota archaeon]
MPDNLKPLEHVKPKKQAVKISEEDKKVLKDFSDKDEPALSTEQQIVLDILTKRKTVSMVTREYNMGLKPLQKNLITEDKVKEILKALAGKNLIKSVVGANKEEYWVDIKYFREKLLGTDKL